MNEKREFQENLNLEKQMDILDLKKRVSEIKK